MRVLLNACPLRASNDVSDLHLRDAEQAGDVSLRRTTCGVEPSNVAHVVRCQLLFGGVATFLGCVAVVVALGAQEQMVRVDAAAVIAAMEHAEPFRDRAVVPFVRQAVRQSLLAVDADCAVAGWDTSGLPLPTVGRCDNADTRPEAWFNRFSAASEHTSFYHFRARH